MARIEASIDIAAPPMSVFRYCHDIERRPEWDERVLNIEMISPRPVRRGSLIRIDAARSGRFHFTWDAEYIHFQMPSGSTLKVIDAAASSPFKSGVEKWEFSQSGSGTSLVLSWEYQTRGIISSLADFLGRRAATGRTIRRSLKNLKARMEGS